MRLFEFGVPPDAVRLDADVHLPAVNANRHQVGLIAVERRTNLTPFLGGIAKNCQLQECKGNDR